MVAVDIFNNDGGQTLCQQQLIANTTSQTIQCVKRVHGNAVRLQILSDYVMLLLYEMEIIGR